MLNCYEIQGVGKIGHRVATKKNVSFVVIRFGLTLSFIYIIMNLENSDNGESVEELTCPTCRLPIGSGSNIRCDRCEIWTHIECEQINPEMYSLLDSSDLGYTYLACTHEIQSEDLNESLCADDRNILESNPLADKEETYKKEGYEPETPIVSVRETVVSSSIPTQVSQTTIPNRIDVPVTGFYGDAVECLTATREIRVRSPSGSGPKIFFFTCYIWRPT